jgi:hypothetical protein
MKDQKLEGFMKEYRGTYKMGCRIGRLIQDYIFAGSAKYAICTRMNYSDRNLLLN